jgi:hypothetical protein
MPTISKKVYLADDIFTAFLDRAHEKHSQTAAFFRYFAMEKYHLFTDVINVYSAHAKVSESLSPTVAKEFLRTITLSNITLLYPDEGDMKAVYKIHLGDRTSDLSLAQTVMAVMADRKGIPQIATYNYMSTMFGLSVFYIPI